MQGFLKGVTYSVSFVTFNRFFLMYCVPCLAGIRNVDQLSDWKTETDSAILPILGSFHLPSNHSAVSCEDQHQITHLGYSPNNKRMILYFV